MVLLGRRKAWGTVLGLVLLGIAGCAVIEELWPGTDELAFSHRLHVEEQGLACEDCHGSWETSDEPGMPDRETCGLCHEAVDEEKEPEDRIDVLFDETGAFRAKHVTVLPDDVYFSHQAHAVDHGLVCSQCHGEVITGDRVDEDDTITMADCSACHADRQVASPSECATCHRTIDRSWVPPSHAEGWTQLHGQVARADDTEVTSNRCALCHTDSTCFQCHQEEMPRDHNNYWRIRGHSLASAIDRDRCWTCHRTDFCERCHSETQPRSHMGAWGSPSDRHCIACHFPLSSESCYTCHKAAPSHDQAPPKPSWHTPGMNCRQCHGTGSLPLPHPDSGTDCNFCHR